MAKRELLKILRLPLRTKTNSGIILITVLWTLIVLSILAMSLGRGTNIELALTKHSIGKLKSKYLAWAGIVYAMEQMNLDLNDGISSTTDSLVFCGIPMNGETSAENLFREHPLPGGQFSVHYARVTGDSGLTKLYYGAQDEERKINLNGLNIQTINVFIQLMVLLGVGDQEAQTVAYSLLDWVDADQSVGMEGYGAEDDYYLTLDRAYRAKNLPLESLAELKLIQGMTDEIFSKIKDYVTVYGTQDRLTMNFDTASEIALQALARGTSGASANTDLSDADSLTEKMISYRYGDDQSENTQDDQILTVNDMSLNEKERVLLVSMEKYRTKKSNIFRIIVDGKEERSQTLTRTETVIDRSRDYSFLYWRRN